MLKEKEQLILLKKFSKLLSEGIPIEKSMILSKFPNKSIEMVKQGLPFSKSCKSIFSEKILSYFELGEFSGDISKAASMACKSISFEIEQKHMLINAFAYPSIIFLFSIFSVIFFSFYIIPQIESVFYTMGVKDIPAFFYIALFAKVLIGFVFLCALFWIFIKNFSKNIVVRKFLEKVIFLLPVFGKIYKKVLLLRFMADLSMLLQYGVPINIALEKAKIPFLSSNFSDDISEIKNEIEKGQKISEAFKTSSIFEDICVKMALLGEETGDLPHSFKTAYEIIFDDIKDFIKSFSLMVEPLATLFVGFFAAVIVFSMLTPITILIDKIQ